MIDTRRFVSLLFVFAATAACSADRAAPARAAQAPEASPSPAASPSPSAGADFAPEARQLYRIVGCAGEETLSQNIDRAAVDAHCAWLAPRVADYESHYLAKARPYLAAIRPAGLPTTVVYPFGGGDLLSALATYPDALEITTLSLEHAGDPRRIHELDKERLTRSLEQLEKRIKGLFAYNESTSENLIQMQRGDLPGQLSFFLVALAVNSYEPVSLRYFRIEPDGSLHYYSTEEIVAEEKKTAKKLNTAWKSPDFSEVFSNMELTFKPRGGAGPVRVHRHIAANLADDFLKKDPSVIAHLEKKGPVSAMTKAASYLLWNPGFSRIRDYLLGHMVFMMSDSTGIPPSYATKAGFVQEVYGRYTGPFLAAPKGPNDEFVKLWKSQPARDLGFRFGYPDASNASHMVVTRKP